MSLGNSREASTAEAVRKGRGGGDVGEVVHGVESSTRCRLQARTLSEVRSHGEL